VESQNQWNIGMMESKKGWNTGKWNDGIMGLSTSFFFASFQYSILPLFLKGG
jgi:hypothetical protein